MRTSPPRFFLRISTFVPSARARRSSASRVSASTDAELLLLFAPPPSRAPRRAPRRRARIQASPDDFLGKLLLVRRGREREKRARVSGVSAHRLERLAHGRYGSLRRRSAFATVARSLPTRSATSSCVRPKSSLQVPIGLGLFENRQVAALHVLDEREEEVVAVRDALAHDDRHLGEPREARRADAPFAREDPVALALLRDEDRLQDPRFRDRARELGEPLVVETVAGLRLVRVEKSESGTMRSRRFPWPRLRRRDQGREAPAERGLSETITGIVTAGERRRGALRSVRSAASRLSSSRAIARYASAPRERASYRRIGLPKDGASASRTLRGTGVLNTRPPKCFLISSRTWRERFVRSSHIVGTTPVSSRSGLRLSSRAQSSRGAPRRPRARSTRTGSAGGARPRRERVQREETEGRRAVDEDVLEAAADAREPLLEPELPPLGAHELDLGAHEVAVRRQQRQARQLGRPGDLLERGLAQQPVVRRARERGLVRRRGRPSRSPAGRGRRGEPAAPARRAPPRG
jgi:hypothetical protein